MPKGGPGNDAIDGGIGDDIVMGGTGDDFTNGGGNINETFLGDGDDFAIAGLGLDAVFGSAGDDWEEGGDMPDLLIGDSSTFFFDDHDVPGNDVMIGQGGDDDGDGEGGDDIFVAGPGVEKNAGAAGYDWNIAVGDPQPQFQDLDQRIIVEGGQPAIEARDKYNEVEALSGWNLNDVLKGDSVRPFDIGGAGTGFIGCNALDQDGLDRITGLDPLVPPLVVDPQPAIDATTTRYCNLDGNVWGEGNILLGGGGSDSIEGRGADDIIDGDKYLNVRLSVRARQEQPGHRDRHHRPHGEHAATSGNFGPGTAGMTLQQAVFAGLVDPGKIAIVREVITPAASFLTGTIDTALFSAPLVGYTITAGPGGSTVISDAAGAAVDGTDTLYNMERAGFCTTTDANGLCTAYEFVTIGGPAPVAPVPAVSATSLTFAARALPAGPAATQVITLTNSGGGALTFTSATDRRCQRSFDGVLHPCNNLRRSRSCRRLHDHGDVRPDGCRRTVGNVDHRHQRRHGACRIDRYWRQQHCSNWCTDDLGYHADSKGSQSLRLWARSPTSTVFPVCSATSGARAPRRPARSTPSSPVQRLHRSRRHRLRSTVASR